MPVYLHVSKWKVLNKFKTTYLTNGKRTEFCSERGSRMLWRECFRHVKKTFGWHSAKRKGSAFSDGRGRPPAGKQTSLRSAESKEESPEDKGQPIRAKLHHKLHIYLKCWWDISHSNTPHRDSVSSFGFRDMCRVEGALNLSFSKRKSHILLQIKKD